MELVFVAAPGQSPDIAELAEVLCAEVNALGTPATLAVGNFPAPRPGLIHALVAPHEYFTLLHGRPGPLPEVLARTIFVCVEPPGTPAHAANRTLTPLGGTVLHINRRAAADLCRHGVDAAHLQLGWSASWARDGATRDIDVAFVGSHTQRRATALGGWAEMLSGHRAHLRFTDIGWPAAAQPESFWTGERRQEVLARSQILVNIHRDPHAQLEWLRVAQAVCAGAVVVTEHSEDLDPLVAGEHIVTGDLASLPHIVEQLLDDPDRLSALRVAAAARLRSAAPMSAAARQLIDAGHHLTQRPVADPAHVFFTQTRPDAVAITASLAPQQPAPVSSTPEAAGLRRRLKTLSLEVIELRRRLASATVTGGPPARLQTIAETPALSGPVPRVSVLTALYDHAAFIVGALDSVTHTTGCSYELIVVDDGSTDGSAERVAAWLQTHPGVPARLLGHPVNQGLAVSRNDALALARGDLCFVLDADNAVLPHCLSRLTEALDADPGAAFAYPTMEMHDGTDSVGLMNTLEWQPHRLRIGNYIDAMAMFRTAVLRDRLGGYPTDPRLHGWEDYAVWCALAGAGIGGVRVPELLGRYRASEESMISLTNISTRDAFAAIIEANPVLMSGIRPPD